MYCMRRIRLRKIKAFTLIEMTLVAIILWILLPSIFSMYGFIIRSNKEVNARQTAIQWWYEFFERLNILMQDYSVDYEEYYNRQMVWCMDDWLNWNTFKRDVWLSWYCSEFTAYWNNNSIWRIASTGRDLYYCTTRHFGQDDRFVSRVVIQNQCGRIGTQQSFGQYANLFIDVKWSELVNWDVVWTSDDEELWRIVNTNGVNAIEDSDHIQEIYLISHDGKDRLYFRRKLVHQEWDHLQYKIQMLRLKWFDAWQQHNFDKTTGNPWIYDWIIDTWACDASMWFRPEDTEGRDSVWWVYSDYYIPATVDDCWVDITQWVTTVRLWNISISPLNDSDLYWADEDYQINPSMRLLIVNWVYGAIYGTGYFSSSINDFNVPLETTINMKDFYKEV